VDWEARALIHHWHCIGCVILVHLRLAVTAACLV